MLPIPDTNRKCSIDCVHAAAVNSSRWRLVRQSCKLRKYIAPRMCVVRNDIRVHAAGAVIHVDVPLLCVGPLLEPSAVRCVRLCVFEFNYSKSQHCEQFDCFSVRLHSDVFNNSERLPILGIAFFSRYGDAMCNTMM